MELCDYLMQFLLENSSIKEEEFDSIHWSLINATKDKKYLLLNGDNGNFVGFLTWEIRISENDNDKIDLGVTNLVIEKRCRGTFPLLRAINHLRKQYSNVDKFIWESRKKNRIFEAKQKDKKCSSIS